MILLISSDNETVSKQGEILKKMGYEYAIAKGAEEGIVLCKGESPIDLAILDIDSLNNPLELISRITDIEDIPFIYLSSGTDNLERFNHGSCYGCIYKNYNESIIAFSINNALEHFKIKKEFENRGKRHKQAELISGFGYWDLDLNKKIVTSSAGARKIYGVDTKYISIEEVQKVPLPSYRSSLDKSLLDLVERGIPYEIEFKVKRLNDGKLITVHSVAEFDRGKNIVRGTLYDISKQKRVEEFIRKREEEYKGIFDNNHSVMLVIDPETGEITNANPAAENYYGWTREELSDMKISDINILGKDEVYDEMQLAKRQEKNFFSFKHRLADGSIRDVEVHSSSVKLWNKKRLFSIIHDVTTRKNAEKAVKHLAYYDQLTKLPNRRKFSDVLREKLVKGDRNGLEIALLYIDLDHFKNINDTYGHYLGDQFLIKVAKRLKNTVKSKKIFRLGGDEFAVIIDKFSSRNEISLICDKISENLKASFNILGNEIFTSASIGISVYPHDGFDFNSILKNSDLAMYEAKNNGKNGYCYFSEEINENLRHRIDIERDLRIALKNNELQLYYQPKIDMRKNKIIGAEALLRWKKDGLDYRYPDEFIPIAEKSGIILEIDKWVLLSACSQIEKWEKLHENSHKVSVNISGMHFKQGRILNTVKEVMEQVDFSPENLEIEITESVFMEDIDEAVATLRELRAMGIKISVDDFGTGYSSLSYLNRLPINRVKIDKSFIFNLGNSEDDAVLTKSIITMANLLKLQVIAEGVETEKQANLLFRYGCYEMQGYYFAKPMALTKYESFLKKMGY